MNTTMEIETQTLFKEEAWGAGGAFKLEILVGATKLPDLTSDEIRTAVRDAVDKIHTAVRGAIAAEDPANKVASMRNRLDLVGLFSEPVFVEEIPNGYCHEWCCKHLPWFVVTTKVGRFKIGWRKRVISLDWSETVGTKTAAELFPKEDVTKGTRTIHAWSYDDARRYINAIVDSSLSLGSAGSNT